MRIAGFFENGFAGRNISSGELLIFAEDHLGRMRSQNDSGATARKFTELIAATQPLFGAFSAAHATENSEGATQQGKTLTKNAAFAAFKALVRLREVRVASELGRPGPGYENFFPHGLKEYNRATMETAETLMDRMVAASEKFRAEVGAEMAVEFADARTAFLNARRAQLAQKGAVSVAAAARKAARKALEVQLMKNVLTIALLFVGQPERAQDFFTQAHLRDPKRRKRQPPPAPPA